MFEDYEMNRQYADRSPQVPRVVTLEMYCQSIKNYNYLVIDPSSRQAVIVDPAWEMEKIDQAILDSQATLRGILITHSHPDHIHLAKPIADKYDCPIWMSKEGISASGFHASQLIGIDTSPLTVGQMLVEPIFTPGHTPGCMCYLIGDSLFSGDVLFAEGCGMCPDIEAAHAMFASLETLKTRLNPRTRVFPGHSYGVPPGQALSQLLKDNIYLQFSNQRSFAAFRLRSGQNLARMFRFS
jgi:hydroxyacylglutathione hydrolase